MSQNIFSQLPDLNDERRELVSQALSVLSSISALSPRRRRVVCQIALQLSEYEIERGRDEQDAAISGHVESARTLFDNLFSGGKEVAEAAKKAATQAGLSATEIASLIAEEDDDDRP